MLTRKTFAERVGVHMTTVRRWEALGIVTPTRETVLGIPTMVYTEADVVFGKALTQVLAEQPGLLSLTEAAEVVRGQR